MDSTKRNKVQFVVEKLIGMAFVFGLSSIVVFHADNINETIVNITITLVALAIATAILFWALKSQGKWFKSKEHVPRKVHVLLVAICNLIVFGILWRQINRHFIFVPAILLCVMECVNYRFNFRQSNEQDNSK